MIIQKRLLKFILNANWALFAMAICAGLLTGSPKFTMGIVCGGLITTVNFHLLYRTLKKSLTSPHLASHRAVLVKYYIRFLVTAVIIGILIAGKYVNPWGLFVGLSVVVASIMIATFRELTILIFKEAF